MSHWLLASWELSWKLSEELPHCIWSMRLPRPSAPHQSQVSLQQSHKFNSLSLIGDLLDIRPCARSEQAGPLPSRNWQSKLQPKTFLKSHCDGKPQSKMRVEIWTKPYCLFLFPKSVYSRISEACWLHYTISYDVHTNIACGWSFRNWCLCLTPRFGLDLWGSSHKWKRNPKYSGISKLRGLKLWMINLLLSLQKNHGIIKKEP